MKGRFYEHLVRVLVFSGSKLSCAELSTSQHDDFNNYCIDCYKCNVPLGIKIMTGHFPLTGTWYLCVNPSYYCIIYCVITVIVYPENDPENYLMSSIGGARCNVQSN